MEKRKRKPKTSPVVQKEDGKVQQEEAVPDGASAAAEAGTTAQ